MRILPVGIVRASDDSCNNALQTAVGARPIVPVATNGGQIPRVAGGNRVACRQRARYWPERLELGHQEILAAFLGSRRRTKTRSPRSDLHVVFLYVVCGQDAGAATEVGARWRRAKNGEPERAFRLSR